MDEIIKHGKLPNHIAIIMDGNGRWAKKQGANRIFGHRNAIKAIRDATEGCAELGIECLTLYAFSTENWSRPEKEVNELMNLLVSTINDEIPTFQKNNIALKAIGDISKLPSKARSKLKGAIEKTSSNSGLKLILALNYSGKWDLTNAVKNIAVDVASGKLGCDKINQSLIDTYLSTNGYRDPELLIRTSGEMRISNFLLWQMAYTEMFFTPVLWPDFRKGHLLEAIKDFQKRERRFGKTSEQLNRK